MSIENLSCLIGAKAIEEYPVASTLAFFATSIGSLFMVIVLGLLVWFFVGTIWELKEKDTK
jgi:hypothetical protein